MKPIEILKQMNLQDQRNKYPTVPEHARVRPKYSDKNANGLTKCIVDYINFIGGIAERRNNQGQWVMPVTYTNVFGKEQLLQKGKWIKGSGLNGTSDVSGVYNGIPVSIEVKIGRDKMSDDQLKYKQRFERAGGKHFIAKNFTDFFNEFNKTMLPSLIEITNFCNDKGYDLHPVKHPEGVKAILFKDDQKIKEGEKVFNNWLDCQKEVYGALYKKLTQT